MEFSHNSQHSLIRKVHPGLRDLQMVFMGGGFTSEGQESSLRSVQLCAKYRLVKSYIKSLPLVLKDKRSCFSQGERSTEQLPLDCVFALRALTTCSTTAQEEPGVLHS